MRRATPGLLAVLFSASVASGCGRVGLELSTGPGDAARDVAPRPDAADAADAADADVLEAGDGLAETGDATDGADTCAPVSEVCNGLDDDCDGDIDEAGAEVSCGPAPGVASWRCAFGACGLEACEPLRANCDLAPATGCEATLGTVGACAGCGDVCAAGEHCASGVCTSDFAVLWVAPSLGGAGDDWSRRSTADEAGNVYVVGDYWGGELGDGAVRLGRGGGDAFAATFDVAGAFRWAWDGGGSAGDRALGVAVGEDGGVYVGGYVSGAVDLGGGVGPVGASTDAFVIALDASGGYRWDRRFASVGEDFTQQLAVLPGGRLVAVGAFWGSIDFGLGVVGPVAQQSGFVVALDAATGTTAWAHVLEASGAGGLWATAVGSDAEGRVAVAGRFLGSADLGAGVVASAGSYDAFVVALDASGAFRWQWVSEGAGAELAWGLAVAPGGSVYSGGDFNGTLDFGGGLVRTSSGGDAYVLALDAGGDYLWDRTFGASSGDGVKGLAVGPTGDVLAAGRFAGSVSFGGAARGSAGGYDAFVVGLDAAGGHLWDVRFGGGAEDEGFGVGVDAAGRVSLAGHFSASVDFGLGLRTSHGGRDPFVVLFAP